MHDAVVVGGGFYGASIAHYLATRRNFRRVRVLDAGDDLMTRASFINQARVHGGYHYPRSFTTAYSSRRNMPRFCEEFGGAVFDAFTSVYALARRNSKVTRRQMERFCREVGAPLEPAPPEVAGLFNTALIECAYLVTEQAFNADALRQIMADRLAAAGVEVRPGHDVSDIVDLGDRTLVRGQADDGPFENEAAFVFNCTYARLQKVAGGAQAPDFRLRHEIAEMILIEPAPEFADLGITIMDGAFFSTMPFPSRGLHSLSHVRYTPHLGWLESPDIDPYARLEAYPKESGVRWMLRDGARYLPALARSAPKSAMFEVKTVLERNEGDDGRPIVFERHGAGGRVFSVLGGKIDNIYDILRRLDAEPMAVAGGMA